MPQTSSPDPRSSAGRTASFPVSGSPSPRLGRSAILSLFGVAVGLALLASWPSSQAAPVVPFDLVLLWPEEQRAFVQDGPGLLWSDLRMEELLGLGPVDRERMIVEFLAQDPVPDTPENELQVGIERRRALARREFMSFIDDRARLLFLHGAPVSRQIVDCAETFRPLELWSYGGDDDRPLVLYRPEPSEPYRLWLPLDSKRVLYNPEMEYWLEQWEELKGRVRGKRFDRQICEEAAEIDKITGVDGLFGFLDDRPKNVEVARFLEPPDDLAAWARKAAATEGVEAHPIEGAELAVRFPERHGLRLLTQALITLPAEAGLEIYEEGDLREYRLRVEGTLERGGKVFENFRVRYQLPAGEEGKAVPLFLIVNRRLRPNEEFILRLRVVEEVSEREALLTHGFIVPREPTPVEEVAVSEEAIIALGEELARNRVEGYDSLILVPPADDVIFGLWRAEALVTGQKIVKVAFFLDDQQVMSRRRPPFTAELRLETYPKEQIVRAEGYDEAGELVSQDEVILNQPRGELRVRILDPARGKPVVAGKVPVRAEVVVPEESRVEKVEVFLNEDVQATLEKPPWEAVIDMPATGALTYITVAAQLEDGTRAEDVRFLNAPNYLEEVDVNLVELFTTVADKGGRLAKGLTQADFQVWEDGRPQEIAKFELVEDLPLTLGITIDTSGSMFESLGEAQRAATDFLEQIITSRDRCFAVAFSDRPALLMQRTSDVGAVAERIQSLAANGSTSLHDAIVTSLYYYRGIRGRRALVVLSDGEDTSSSVGFAEALEYAKRSGVAIYTIGLNISSLDVGVRRKLERLSTETGGRSFFIKEANELFTTYGEIEEELRSQYLVAYSSDQPGGDGTYREVKVEVKGGKLKARTIRGYYS